MEGRLGGSGTRTFAQCCVSGQLSSKQRDDEDEMLSLRAQNDTGKGAGAT